MPMWELTPDGKRALVVAPPGKQRDAPTMAQTPRK
jgi:hypothetical protein